MKIVKAGILAVTAVALGGTLFVSSTFAGPAAAPRLEVIRHAADGSVVNKVRPVSCVSDVESKIRLVPPPAELPNVPSRKMVTSLKPVVPPAQTRTTVAQARPAPAVNKTQRVVTAQAKAQKVKPEKLFSYVRLLNYAPHPLTEEFLKKEPLNCNGRNYWFSVKYDEEWKVIGDEEGYINGISFEIDMMENANKVRSLKTPKVAINPKTLKKGMVLGIAEVAPYKFTISVEEFTRTKKGISELVFKLDLVG